MISLAASIPPELFKDILSFVGDTTLLIPQAQSSEDQPARRAEMKHLSVCASTCIYWARLTRERMLSMLILRSYTDLCDFRSLLRAPSSTRLDPIGNLVQALYVFYKLDDRFWPHNVGGLKVHGLRSLYRMVMHVRGPIPNGFTAHNNQAVLHPLFVSMPKALSMGLRTCTNGLHIMIADIHFPNLIILHNLLQDLVSLGPLNMICSRLTWDTGPESPSLHPNGMGFSCSLSNVHVTGCTNDFLVAGMVVNIPRRQYRQPCVSLSDTVHLVDIQRSCTDPHNRSEIFCMELLSEIGLSNSQRITGARLPEGAFIICVRVRTTLLNGVVVMLTVL